MDHNRVPELSLRIFPIYSIFQWHRVNNIPSIKEDIDTAS